MTRRLTVLIALATMLAVSCSGSNSSPGDTTTSTSTTGDPTSTVTGATSTSAPSTSAPPATTAPTTTAATTTTAGPAAPPVAEANGWRLVVTQPAPGSAIGTRPLLCYEATGTSREAILALDIQVITAATGSVAVDERRDITVGRDGIEIDLSGLEPGSYRLVVGLVIDGAPPDGLTLEVPDLNLVEGTSAVPCE